MLGLVEVDTHLTAPHPPATAVRPLRRYRTVQCWNPVDAMPSFDRTDRRPLPVTLATSTGNAYAVYLLRIETKDAIFILSGFFPLFLFST